MYRLPVSLLMTSLSLALAACAVSPFNKIGLEQADRSISYNEAAQSPESVRGRQVVFGGSIVSTRNFSRHSEMTVLAFPLDDKHRPELATAPLGRFIVSKPGYLESVQYAPGRLISVRGSLAGTRREALEHTSVSYPLLETREMHLWSYADDYNGDYADRRSILPPWLNIGIGIGVGF